MQKTLILSRYVFLFQRDGVYFLYNSRTCSFYEVPKDTYIILKTMRDNKSTIDASSDFIADLRKKKIVVSESDDDAYRDYLKLSYMRVAFSVACLNLTLVPTVSCNLRCPYCFEESKPKGMMDNDTIGKLAKFIKNSATSNKYSITWFGGEPLIGINVIEQILSHLSEMEDLKLIYHSIVTNGTLLNGKARGVFRKYPLDSIQITLDGMKDSHDSKRHFEPGKGTFDIILKNIEEFLMEFSNTQVTFRVNIDNGNRNEYLDVHKTLSERFKGYSISIYPGILRANKGCEDETFLSSEEHLEFSTGLWRSRLHDMYPYHCSKGCCATSMSSYVIGPRGELYLCWEHVGNPTKEIGYIDGSPGSATSLYARFKLHGHCFDDERCLNCGLLPLCSGGCPDKRIRNLLEGEEHNLCTVYTEKGNKGLGDALYEYYKIETTTQSNTDTNEN